LILFANGTAAGEKINPIRTLNMDKTSSGPPLSATLSRPAVSMGRGLAPGLQRVGPLCVIPELLRESGVQPARVLKSAGLDADALSDPDRRIPFAQCLFLLARCAEATDIPEFGLRAAARWRLHHIGTVGHLLECCATLGQALDLFAAFQWMNAAGGALLVRREAAVTSVGYAIYEPQASHGVQEGYDLTMGIGIQLVRQLTQQPTWSPTRVQIARPRPENAEPYARYFGAPVRFNAEATLLQYPGHIDAAPLPGRNDARRRQLLDMIAGKREELIPRLHRMVRVALLFGLSAEELVAPMFVSQRTLNRRLAGMGTSLREIIGQVRFEAAKQLLRDTTLSVSEIAGALGYSEAPAFVRAFQRWAGTSPGLWRDRFARASLIGDAAESVTS
jgi:AraC-like DNA-binding protein